MRRKVVRKTKPSAAQDDKKLQGALKKLNVQPIPGVEEVNMFREDGNVLHFTAPKGGSEHLRRLPANKLAFGLLRQIRFVLTSDFFLFALYSTCRGLRQHFCDLRNGTCQGAY
jgi:hypothetical protein